ncbi:class I SAM-dependent methyltransferase [Sinomicrobium weinanense]|uniref:Class I SAM-dependent methyltransferase n=1 Tax=Sinomicrobium weinanense TaxID=2842200 RepID=A0A926JUJ3_9FLAO|nr:class I SAM-dependent methyltransferase [Sinomicrobium weinanense]MBC9797792.1 class I SAM-dependent methyltransferase [Sinomicrobium weinanense]MBU3124876.1 class I SAM-dependent methyltransferase [Sinomicrobium weinanense]
MDKKTHWEKVYTTKEPDEVSWTQEIPSTSLDFITSLAPDKNAKIIDIGGGDSKLADFLLDKGYTDISVLDISEKALDKAKKRLGKKAGKVKWIVSDITEFEPDENYDLWHDRATFHFLTQSEQIEKYTRTARQAIKGALILGTFSENGPKKCSGLDIKQYSEGEMEHLLTARGFEKIKCITEDHTTPFGTTQNFLFCSFRKN